MDSMLTAQLDQAARQATGSAPALGAGGDESGRRFRTVEQARGAAREFEAFFLSQMLQPMFSGLSSEPPFGGGHAEQVWRSLLVDEYGKMMARRGGVGIADAVLKTMLAAQEGQATPQTRSL
ncbi:rod-binding protein [Roseospira goensis]|uniref:Rod binding domain-containing protein n=1 Tax=Roseospira goensis TaxID=391922 RepID=A0A7W6S007_9PROT|nr:rod-binding protein [Roseospira goensis]MBB4286369.1 Rod binding domain-containing protein [Roseospira goensis]